MKNVEKEWHCFIFLSIFNVWLHGSDSWILLSVAAFSLLYCVVLTEVYEDNLSSHIYVVEKREEYFNTFLDNYAYSLTLLQTQQVVIP